MSAITPDLRHGEPKVTRNDRYTFDRYEWPNGLTLFIYDDGRVKLDRLDATVTITAVNSYGSSGKERASAHVIARFEATEGDAEEHGLIPSTPEEEDRSERGIAAAGRRVGQGHRDSA
ncbi:hypothetical protein ACFY4C_41570 [Actinomadura viridis]|uniref:hypothetical protein n=1 Tax=Actinomadura viridis TaxID=58110 RepID=UPI0036D0F80A